jgi:hypothetical protein
MLLQSDVVLSNEQILIVTGRGARGKFRAQPMHKSDEITRHARSLYVHEALWFPLLEHHLRISMRPYFGGAGIAEE